MEARVIFGALIVMILYGAAYGFQCSEQPRKLGCFQDSLKNRLMATHAFSVKMKNSDWLGNKWNEHLDKLLCKCSEEAKKGGYLYFGLQNYYECWHSNLDHIDVETRRLHDKSKCWSKNPSPFECNAVGDHVCVGASLTMVIYEVKYSSYIIPETEEPTIKVMTLPKKKHRPPPKIPVFPNLGRR